MAMMQIVQAVAEEKSFEKDFEQRVGGLVSQLDKSGTKALNVPLPDGTAGVTKGSRDMATILLDLVTIASQLARVDQMLEQVTQGAPDAEDAKQWQQISLQALTCSRDVLADKQKRILEEMMALANPGGSLAECESVPKTEPALDRTQKCVAPDAEESPTWMGFSKDDVQAIPEFVPPALPEDLSSGSLRQDLEKLRKYESDCVIILRKIKKLGFESPKLLEEYFSQYGDVAEVLVAHSHVKPTTKRPNGRVRPAALGFIVLGSAEAASRALAAGGEQEVCGTMIELSAFEAFEF